MKKKVLIVEDNKEDATLLYELFKRHGNQEIAVATNYDKAIELLKNNNFKAIIADVNLHGHKFSGKNGFSVVSYARSVLDIHVPVIYYTGFPKEMYDGNDTYILKPNFKKLINEYDKLLTVANA
jgi:CheY-like chemotaxis protein